MNHHTSPSFRVAFEKLPREIQDLARTNYELLRDNPRHPSLHFKKSVATGPFELDSDIGPSALM